MTLAGRAARETLGIGTVVRGLFHNAIVAAAIGKIQIAGAVHRNPLHKTKRDAEG